jgi:alanyl-tRNA synthetase
MKPKELRASFVNYFEKHGHQKVASSSLIPHNDPTLLFTNAGMNQFKDYFTDKEKPKNKRAVSVQKCVRAGGKHNDLENVGFTARHHTFFEMLGNFSFGDYFKSQAIEFAWNFLTKELKLPKEKLYITVHESDDQAKVIWMKEQGISEDRIFKMGDKDNFWEMGETGPCGPCSEIFYDHGEKYSSGNFSHPMEDEHRCVEIWNLVFMQYEKHSDGTRTNLPFPCVDTGAGLERLASVVQGVYWNYDTDLFTPIIKKIESITGKKSTTYLNNMRVIADHIRASVMLITDGALPSNEGRGYVLRRIIRRAVRHANELGFQGNILHQLVGIVFEILGSEYQENQKNSELAEKTLLREEQSFRQTLENGLKILNDYLQENKTTILNGVIAFKLYDTYGFPLDLTQNILQEKNMSVDLTGFNKEMQKQVSLSKKSQKFNIDQNQNQELSNLKEKFGETDFQGYQNEQLSAKLLAIETFNEHVALIFDKTPFYAESGGQIGDQGIIEEENIKIIDTQKPLENFFIHLIENKKNNLKIGNTYSLKVDRKRKELIKRNHSATHLLQSALIETLGSHIKQAGSLVTEEKLRFDFTHDCALSKEELNKVQTIVNQAIEDNLQVNSEITSKEDAIKKGAMALFGEKYSEDVRVISMGDVSLELCGGTHVSKTGEIGTFTFISEASLATGVRRIEAKTSIGAIDFLTKRSKILAKIEHSLKTKDKQSIDKVESLQDEVKILNKKIEELSENLLSFKSQNIFSDFTKINSNSSLCFVNTAEKDLRKIGDIFLEKYPKDILLIIRKDEFNSSFLLRSDKKSALKLNEIAQSAIKEFNGRGGGKPFMVQGSIDAGHELKFKDSILKSLQL